MKKMRRTKGKYEIYLNNFITDNYSLEDAIKKFIYLAKRKKGPVSKSKITKRYYSRTIGTYIRRKDPVAFNVGYEEWRAE